MVKGVEAFESVDHCRAELGDGFVKLWNRAEEEEAGSRKQGEQGGCGETFPSGATPGAGMLRGAGSCEDGGVQVGGWTLARLVAKARSKACSR